MSKRYKLYYNNDFGDEYEAFSTEDEDGDWVEYEGYNALEQQLKDCREFIEKSRPKHRSCDDTYYNCNKLSWDDEIYPDIECSCGADETNKEIDELLKGGK